MGLGIFIKKIDIDDRIYIVLEKLNKKSTVCVSFMQSILLTAYIFLIGFFMVNANNWFGPMNKTPILGPVLFLTIFILSAIISASLVLAYPFYTFWVKKDLNKAAKILIQTVFWLVIYLFVFLAIITI